MENKKPVNTIVDITNNNTKNNPSDDIYKVFNDFIFSDDKKLLGKLLHRFDFYKKIAHLPGDLIDGGVFKGSGVATFLKFLDIFEPNSNRKVIGFDIFDTLDAQDHLSKDSELDKDTMNIVYDRVDHSELSLEAVTERINKTKIDSERYKLVAGDVEETLPIFLKENPGFRVSLLYIDVDLDRPTYFLLKHLWDRILPGGIVLFDEYEYHKFSESNGVERFFKEKGIEFELKTTNWIAPTAYLVKKGF